MITIHHLGMSRSERIIWLAEELGLEYEIVNHQRDDNFRSPESLWEFHPLGKAPVIQDGDTIIYESGAIIELLIERYGNGRLVPDRNSDAYIEYLQWMHGAESTLMTPVMVRFLSTAMGIESETLQGFVDGEFTTVFGFLDTLLSGREYIASNDFSAADIMVSYPLLMAEGLQPPPFANYPSLTAYIQRLKSRPAYARAAVKF